MQVLIIIAAACVALFIFAGGFAVYRTMSKQLAPPKVMFHCTHRYMVHKAVVNGDKVIREWTECVDCREVLWERVHTDEGPTNSSHGR